MNRHTCLEVLALSFLSLAGCLRQDSTGGAGYGGYQATATMNMSPITDTEIANRFVYRMDDGPERKRRLVERIVTNGSVTVRAGEPPIKNTDRVILPAVSLSRISPPRGGEYPHEVTAGSISNNGTIYTVSYERNGEETAIRYRVTINPMEDRISDVETVAFEELPAVDREKVNQQMIGTGTQFTYSREERDRSALVPSPDKQIIVWDSGERARFTVRKSETVVVQATYRYTAETVTSVAEFGTEFRQQHGWKLTGLSEAERDIVDQAISKEDGYSVAPREAEPEATPSKALERLIERFRQHIEKGFAPRGQQNHSGVQGWYLNRYDGKTYWTKLTIDEEEF